MKKLVIAVLFAVFFFAGSSLFAQSAQSDSETEYYYHNISIERIWPYRAGYIVQYRRGFLQHGRAYLPISWFTSTAGKGEIIKLPPGNAWPYMSIYYKNGEFGHVRLYVHRWNSHPTWGNVPQTVNLSHEFDDIENITIQFR